MEHVRLHPEMYLPRGNPDGSTLASRLVGDILTFFKDRAYALHSGDWRVVASEDDWNERIVGSSGRDYFKEIIPFPEAGQNAMHSGILLTAFAKDVMTFDEISTLVIRGEAEPSEPEPKVREPLEAGNGRSHSGYQSEWSADRLAATETRPNRLQFKGTRLFLDSAKSDDSREYPIFDSIERTSTNGIQICN